MQGQLRFDISANAKFYGIIVILKFCNNNNTYSRTNRHMFAGKWIAIAMVSNLQVFALGIPVLLITGDDPEASFFVRSGVIFLNDFSVLM